MTISIRTRLDEIVARRAGGIDRAKLKEAIAEAIRESREDQRAYDRIRSDSMKALHDPKPIGLVQKIVP